MRFGAHVADLEQDIAGHLVLNGEIVLLGILRTHVRLELAVEQDRPEGGPIHGLAAHGIQDAVERIRDLRCHPGRRTAC